MARDHDWEHTGSDEVQRLTRQQYDVLNAALILAVILRSYRPTSQAHSTTKCITLQSYLSITQCVVLALRSMEIRQYMPASLHVHLAKIEHSIM